MTKKPSAGARAMSKPASPASSEQPADVNGTATSNDLKGAGRTALAMGKSAGRRIAATTKSAGKKAAVLVGDLNKDGNVDHEDATIAAAKAKGIASRVTKEAGTLAKAAAKHDMVRDAAAGAAIGAAVAIPVPIIGPAVGAAIGAIVGVAKNLRSASKPAEATGKQPKPSTVKSTGRRRRKPAVRCRHACREATHIT